MFWEGEISIERKKVPRKRVGRTRLLSRVDGIEYGESHPLSLTIGTGMERIGDESLTLCDSGFVHGHIFRLFWNTVLDAESAAIKKGAPGQNGPACVNLHEKSVEQLLRPLGKLLLTLVKINRMVSADPRKIGPSVNDSTKSGTKRRRIAD